MKTWYNDMDGKRQVNHLQAELEMVNLNSMFQFAGLEPRHCSTFGCGKLLTITEAMAGTKCLKCQTNEKPIFKHYNL